MGDTPRHWAGINSDVVGIFSKLRPAPGLDRNVLIVFSDGKESGKAGIDLEDGHSCVTEGNLQSLLDRALQGRAPANGLERFEAIKWVVPADSGVKGCNSRDELQFFWRALIGRRAQPGRAPELVFDTNVF